MSIRITNTYGTAHHVSETNPAHVTSCDRYRLPLVGAIVPGNPGYEDMVEILKDNGHDTRPEGYGLIFLESEEFSATYFGSIAQIEQYKRDNADGTATFDASQGVMYAQWPHGKGWDDFLPRQHRRRELPVHPIMQRPAIRAFHSNLCLVQRFESYYRCAQPWLSREAYGTTIADWPPSLPRTVPEGRLEPVAPPRATPRVPALPCQGQPPTVMASRWVV
ncbi:hypothetical protein ACFT5D_00545 [Streptomyces sp. NPDC057144]|uniref:hypothetical protein n=1 Tax=Streptomyces sp. NPDC057144 TaxID=3346034 RepID=UPI0036386BBC